MHIENMPATWAAWNVGGRNNPQRTLTVKLATELADKGPVGEAILEHWPMLERALDGEHAMKLAESAAAVLGDGQHIVRVWGMDAQHRHEHSTPILETQGAMLAGQLGAEVEVTDGVGTAKLTLKFKGASGEWFARAADGTTGSWNGHELDRQQGCDVWLDVIPTQVSIDAGSPAAEDQTSLLDGVAS